MMRFPSVVLVMGLLCMASVASSVSFNTNTKLNYNRRLKQSSQPQPTPVTPAAHLMNQTVEHIVLFKMKNGTDEETLIDAMNSLKTLPGVLYLSAGYTHGIHASPLDFNIFLHSRHATKAHLDAYMGHRLKYGFTMTYTEPYYQDYMIIDYVHEHHGLLQRPTLGNALRATFFNLKDGWGERDKDRVVEVMKESLTGSIEQQTFGETYEGTTYRPAHKGYEVGMLAVFPGLAELKALGTPQEFAQKMNEKLKATLDQNVTVFVVDFVLKEVYDGNRENIW